MSDENETSEVNGAGEAGAASGGPEAGDAATASAWLFGFAAGAVILFLLIAAYLIGFNRGEDEGPGDVAGAPTQTRQADPADDGSAEPDAAPDGSAEPDAASEEPPAVEEPERDLFVASCGSCHTLAAAGTSGAVGPDLDRLSPDEAQTLAAIENGGASGGMPPNLLSGQEAADVAAYVAGAASP